MPDCPGKHGNKFDLCHNVTEFNGEGIKSFHDNNLVHVQLYFIRLLVVQKFSITKVLLTFKIQQKISHFIENG